MNVEVTHDRAGRRFVAAVDGAEAFVSYEEEEGMTGHRVLVLDHTYTPVSLRGRGVASRVVRAALEHARETGAAVEPRCSYAEQFIQRHPEFQDLLNGPDFGR